MNLNVDLKELVGRLNSVNVSDVLKRKPPKRDSGTSFTGNAADFEPDPPRVNLLPPDAMKRASDRHDRKVAVGIWAGALVVVLGVFGLGFQGQQSAHNALEAESERGEQLALDLAYYAPVTNLFDQTQALKNTVASQTEGVVGHDLVLKRFLASVSPSMEPESIQITTDGPGSCVSVDPFQKVPLSGCVTFSGKAAGSASAPEIVSLLNDDPWFVDAFIPTVGSSSDGETTLSGTVGVVLDAAADQDGGADAKPADEGDKETNN